MSKYGIGQPVKVTDKESSYWNYTGTVRQVTGIDFGAGADADLYIIEFIDWPDGCSPTSRFSERQLADAPDAII